MLFQVRVANHELDLARSELIAAETILSRNPSLLRHFWGQLCWVRYQRASGDFAAAQALVERLASQIDPAIAPRLARNISEARRLINERSDLPNIKLPPRAAPALLGRKPMLNSLYAYLQSAGPVGATKEDITRSVWEETYNPTIHDDRIYKTIARLRKLLGDCHSSPNHLIQRGRHYVLATPHVTLPAGSRGDACTPDLAD
jgi:hypothetical protein